ncbi:MAG TPA: glycosyltransferase family 87 protein [Vicinamibacterales bacterium]|nr:glycosyltransferase family 87 protein [Vicinamibacterales bacterium]
MQRPRHGAIVAGAAAAIVLAAFTSFSAGSKTHGFISYYTASRLLVEGELGPRAYNDRWFGAVVQRLTQTSLREIFTPNPPPMALMSLPLVGFGPEAARVVWLVASLAAFLGGVGALVRYRAARHLHLSIAVVLLMLLTPAVFTNLRIGQGYLFVFALFAAMTLLLLHGRDRLAGICLGLLLVLKTSGLAMCVLLIARRRWPTLIAAAITSVMVALAMTPWIDPSMWLVYPSAVRDYVARPASAVTAYQTTLSLFRHLCIADPQWNPEPAANCASIAFVAPYLLIGAATIVTALLARRAARADDWIAAGVVLSVLSLPAVAEPHFVLMGIPLALLRLSAPEIAVIAGLLIVPLEITAERFTTGWSAVLAYPRLYAAWLLWLACIRALSGAKMRSNL